MDRFWTQVAGMFAQQGVLLQPNGGIELDPTYEGSKAQPTEDEIEYMNDSLAWDDFHSRLKQNWVRNFVGVVDEVADSGAGAPWASFAVFWIRLHGVLVELRAELALVEKIASDMRPLDRKPTPGSALASGFRVLEAFEEIRAVFTDDELVYAEYRRHTEAHPVQHGYRLRWSKKSGLIDTRPVPALGKVMSLADIDGALERVLRRYRGETAIAVDFARRVQQPAHRLLEVAVPFYSGGR